MTNSHGIGGIFPIFEKTENNFKKNLSTLLNLWILKKNSLYSFKIYSNLVEATFHLSPCIIDDQPLAKFCRSLKKLKPISNKFVNFTEFMNTKKNVPVLIQKL